MCCKSTVFFPTYSYRRTARSWDPENTHTQCSSEGFEDYTRAKLRLHKLLRVTHFLNTTLTAEVNGISFFRLRLRFFPHKFLLWSIKQNAGIQLRSWGGENFSVTLTKAPNLVSASSRRFHLPIELHMNKSNKCMWQISYIFIWWRPHSHCCPGQLPIWPIRKIKQKNANLLTRYHFGLLRTTVLLLLNYLREIEIIYNNGLNSFEHTSHSSTNQASTKWKLAAHIDKNMAFLPKYKGS